MPFTVVIFGAGISIRLVIDEERLFFQGELNLWNLFRVYLLVELNYTATDPGLHVIGEMQNDLFTKIKQRATQKIRQEAHEINEKISGAQQKIKNAKDEVDKLWNTINYHKQKIEEAKHECSSAPWYKKYKCIKTGFRIIYHGTIIAGVYVAWGAAKLVLEVANLFLEAVKGLIKVGAEVVATLVNAALSIIDIKYIRFVMTLNKETKIFNFDSEIVVLGWTVKPSFEINFSSSSTANAGINDAGDKVSMDTMKNVKKE